MVMYDPKERMTGTDVETTTGDVDQAEMETAAGDGGMTTDNLRVDEDQEDDDDNDDGEAE